MRFYLLALFALIYLTQFTLAAKGGGGSGGGDSSGGSSSSGGGSSSVGGGSSNQNSTESAAMSMYATPNSQTYLNVQNVLMAAGVLALAQHHLSRH
ncbi:hypothetical protein BDA99DRAFT_603386 [Phascolomyces articulosus]|uniref:Uncharacterized protein n=1 Tax=Phascolomyces articulosus TaxID=60185 RepID=A0AAD5KKH5_9FUNG|nr:hypothetical protein BDA99DRAFT_603386 [Phascolomyces articulosus]